MNLPDVFFLHVAKSCSCEMEQLELVAYKCLNLTCAGVQPSSVRSHPIRRALPAAGGATEPLSLLPAGVGLRSGTFLGVGVHGAERPAA